MSVLLIVVFLAVNTVDDATHFLAFRWNWFATVFTFCQRWAIEFWGVSNGSLDGLLGDVIGLVDNVGHRIFPIQLITSGIALVLRTGKAVLCLSVLRFSKNPALHGFKAINY